MVAADPAQEAIWNTDSRFARTGLPTMDGAQKVKKLKKKQKKVLGMDYVFRKEFEYCFGVHAICKLWAIIFKLIVYSPSFPHRRWNRGLC